MNSIQFTRDFPDEAACRAHFRAARELEGIVCKKCGCKKHWWLKNKDQWKCSGCDFRTTIRSGTFMHRIRRAMGDRDSLYGLSYMQEVDEVLLKKI